MDRLTQLRAYPNSSTIAYYDPLLMIICLSKYSKANIEELKHDPCFLSVLEHEHQHWIDHVSTYSGLLAYNAVQAWEQKNEQNFWRIPLYFSGLQKNNLRSYFSEIYCSDTAQVATDWTWGPSFGLGFTPEGRLNENKPMTFIRFIRTVDGYPIARVPITIESFLEARAIYKELHVTVNELLRLKETDAVTYHIEKRELQKEYYTPGLLVYSVIAHTISTSLNITDIFEAFHIASEISLLMLNLSPSVDLGKMKINERFQVHAVSSRIPNHIRNRDVGFVFLNTLWNYKDYIDDKPERALSIETYLQASNLPNLQDWERLTLIDIEALKEDIIDGRYASRLNTMVDTRIANPNLFYPLELETHPFPFRLYCGDEPNWEHEHEYLRDVFAKCDGLFSVCVI